MGRMPGADWRPIPNLYPGQMSHPVRGVIMHVIVGTVEAADGLFRSHPERASAHFGVKKDGYIRQWVDTRDKANAQGAGNREWVSIEFEGHPPEPLTDGQIRAGARIYAWVHETDGIPFSITDSVTGRGFGTHVMGGGAWGGHTCPGPGPRAGQRADILRVAQGLPGPVPSTPSEADMAERGILVDVVFHSGDPLSGWTLDRAGGIHPFGKAKAAVGGPTFKVDGKNLGDGARKLTIRNPEIPSGYVWDLTGAAHAFGGAPALGATAHWPYTGLDPLRP